MQMNKSLHLRNKFDFWNVHGNMNTSGLLQSLHEGQTGLYVNFAKHQKYS